MTPPTCSPPSTPCAAASSTPPSLPTTDTRKPPPDLRITELAGKEGLVIRRTIWHSLALATILGVIVMLQQYVVPGVIPP